ncbi:MAG: gliding motility protein GldC [Calditrichaeota bacterium]|nr:gliding motility protein GldC [Calditrichota bacterium]
MARSSELKFTIHLDEKKFPVKIEWEATDADFEGKRECDALMVSLWDKAEKNTMGIDLWTTEMLIFDMNVHVFQTLMKMADTYLKATNNLRVANMITDFAQQFARETQVLSDENG